jgi:hypothetical protein
VLIYFSETDIGFYESQFSGSAVVICGQTDMAKLIGAFFFATSRCNAPKIIGVSQKM